MQALKGYVYYGQKVGHTNTKPGAKMRSESVKGCQWVLIQSWTSVLATLLQLRNHVFLPW